MKTLTLSALITAAAASPVGNTLSTRQSTCPALPTSPNLTAVATLPNPFVSLSGSAITTAAQWTCRQSELSQLFQRYELGTKPGAPDSFSASFSGNKLTMTSTVSGRSMTFSVTITKPSGTGPFPAIIVYGGASIPIPAGVATIVFDNTGFAQQTDQSSRGKGLFYNLYGASAPAGAMSAWAWGVSRILDGLAAAPAAGIDATRVGVTGCSRNGKGAFVAGALDSRIALTIPQESGSGGAGCWRLSDDMMSRGISTQTASEIVGENVWFGTAFNAFSAAGASGDQRLPFDHHELAGLVAPRGLFVIENTDYVWLGPWSALGCMTVGRRVYQALGAQDKMGFSQVGGHAHCSFPSSQQADLSAFINRFLLKQNVNTNIFRTTLTETFDQNRWAPWSTPKLA